MLRRTKIVATLGPATDDPAVLDAMIKAGLDVARINFSHGSPDDHRRRVELVRRRAAAAGRAIGVLMDLQGPKIRIERFADGAIELVDGALFALDTTLAADAGDTAQVGVAYKELPADVVPGDTLLLDDGAIMLTVVDVTATRIKTRVAVGGKLSNNKGINRQGGGLSAAALTDKDREDIRIAAELSADYLALSFPRDAADVEMARVLMEQAGGESRIIAKIERTEAVQDAEAIIAAADAIMVARGDLGVELGDAEVPGVQKRLIRMARQRDRVVITATQMLQSMVDSPIPTRAEVSDVSNAVLDGTDAVMLSAETATGKFPVKAIAAMDRVCRSAERQREAMSSNHRMDDSFHRVDEAVAMAAMYVANHLPVRAIAAMTESGDTPLWMSRISSGIPIYAMTPHESTQRRVTLYRGVYPVPCATPADHTTANRLAIDELKKRGAVEDGDMVIITKGDLMGLHGGTNAIKVVRVGELVPIED
ncbi:MAG: pyruvate kinase [Proteobacteria bacterium]|nr:MAG: pyruvate kinase [Pseudomonadota bacterium]QKK11192.1 MAG: pyruvate kinase [Pseudomonadota bacterium]